MEGKTQAEWTPHCEFPEVGDKAQGGFGKWDGGMKGCMSMSADKVTQGSKNDGTNDAGWAQESGLGHHTESCKSHDQQPERSTFNSSSGTHHKAHV